MKAPPEELKQKRKQLQEYLEFSTPSSEARGQRYGMAYAPEAPVNQARLPLLSSASLPLFQVSVQSGPWTDHVHPNPCLRLCF